MIIHIVAKGPGFLDAPARSENGEYEVWGLNDTPLYKKIDVLFNMHDIAKQPSPNKLCMVVAEQDKIPLYTLKKCDWLSNSKQYPFKTIVKKFLAGSMSGSIELEYFSSSLCYMVALAIHKGATEIHLHGASYFTNQRDNMQERSGVEFWLGVAIGRGIKVHAHGPTSLLKAGPNNDLYGYENNDIDYDHMFDEERWQKHEEKRIKQERIKNSLTVQANLQPKAA
jgi:hypothetical protein